MSLSGQPAPRRPLELAVGWQSQHPWCNGLSGISVKDAARDPGRELRPATCNLPSTPAKKRDNRKHS